MLKLIKKILARSPGANYMRAFRDYFVSKLKALKELKLLICRQLGIFEYPKVHSGVKAFFSKVTSYDDFYNAKPILKKIHLELINEIKKNPAALEKLSAHIDAFSRASSQSLKAPNTFKNDTTHLKILYVSGMFPSIEHAGGLRLFDIVKHLAKRHEVDLYSVYDKPLDENSYHKLKAALGRHQLVPYHEFNAENLIRWFKDIGINPNHYDVIQLEYPISANLLESATPYSKRIGFTLMECVTRSQVLDFIHAPFKRDKNAYDTICSLFEIATLETLALKKSDFSIAVTDVDANFCKKMTGIRPFVVSTGISSEISEKITPDAQPKNSTKKIAAFVGYFDHSPNIDGMLWYLTKIHPLVKRAIPEYEVLIIGRGDTSRLIEVAQGDPSVKFTGRVDSVAEQILLADICISPLISGAGLRGKINQYSYCRKPTVSTSIGVSGMPYLHNESVLVADDPTLFANCIISLFSNETLRKKIQINAIQIVDTHFNWDVQVPKIEQIYRGYVD